MEARERAVAIGILFVGVEHEKVITPETLEGTRQHILTAQREAIEFYQANIRAYGDEIPAARWVCDKLVGCGDALLDAYR